MNYNYNNLKEDEHVFHMWEVMNFNITDKYKFIKRNFIFNLISNINFIISFYVEIEKIGLTT